MDHRESIRQRASFHNSDLQDEFQGLPRSSAAIRRASSTGVRKQAASGPVVIKVSATGSWTDEFGLAASDADPDAELKTQQAVKAHKQGWPRWLKRLAACTIILGMLATAILVPISQTIGFTHKRLPVHRVLQPLTQPYKLVFAFHNKTIVSATCIVPQDAAAHVLQWIALQSSGVHVAVFNEQSAMQQTLAALVGMESLRYAVSDFRLVPDRQVSRVIDPDQLFQLSRLPTRQLQQQQQPSPERRLQYIASSQQRSQVIDSFAEQQQQRQPGRQHACSTNKPIAGTETEVAGCTASSGTRGSGAASSKFFSHNKQATAAVAAAAKAPAASKLMATHLQRLEERKAKRRRLMSQQQFSQLLLPTNARQKQQRQPHGVASFMGQQLGAASNDADTAVHTDVKASPEHIAYSAYTAVGSTAHGRSCSRTSAAAAGVGRSDILPDLQGQDSTASTDKGAAAGIAKHNTAHGRKLQQYQPASPSSQPQQRQVQQHIQKGGAGVAWYLGDAGLNMQEAWNITYGYDDIVVAVLDTGVELSHGGVGAAVWANAGEVANDGVDNDGNGYIDDVMGWDFGGSCADAACTFCASGPDSSDITGWGTHAAAVIAAQPEVASGTAGIAPGVRIMPLKVADCRGSGHLGGSLDAATYYHQQQQQAGDRGAVDINSSSSKTAAGQGDLDASGPVMWGSAALQALDYAYQNGAHIVLAAWRVGQAMTYSSSSSNDTSSAGSRSGTVLPNCALGPSAAAAPGVPVWFTSAADCVAAVQQLVFLDALQPLQQAGVLVVTTSAGTVAAGEESNSEDSCGSSSSASSQEAAAAVPCSLGFELDNVLCIGMSCDSTNGESMLHTVSAASYFEPLIVAVTGNISNIIVDPEDRSRQAIPGLVTPARTALPPFASINDTPKSKSNRDAADTSPAHIKASNRFQLQAPGANILAGWAWGSHAVVSGSSTAAAVAAGAAALVWSALGQALGAQASPGAYDGLGQLVKQVMVSSADSKSKARSSAARQAGVTALVAPGSSGSASDGADVGVDIHEASRSKWLPSSAVVDSQLKLLNAIKLAQAYEGTLPLKRSVVSPSVTVATNTLSHSWYISTTSSGPFNTQGMVFVARKTLQPPAFPINSWEFYGETALVEVEGFVQVQNPGVYSMAATSRDKFLIWLQDKWLVMDTAGPGDAAYGLTGNAWVAQVNFTAAGDYKLRVIVYKPQLSPFDLQWLQPGETRFTSIPQFISFGSTQPQPQQLLDSVLRNILVADSSAGSRSSGRRSTTSSSNSRSSSGDGSSHVSGNNRFAGETFVASTAHTDGAAEAPAAASAGSSTSASDANTVSGSDAAGLAAADGIDDIGLGPASTASFADSSSSIMDGEDTTNVASTTTSGTAGSDSIKNAVVQGYNNDHSSGAGTSGDSNMVVNTFSRPRSYFGNLFDLMSMAFGQRFEWAAASHQPDSANVSHSDGSSSSAAAAAAATESNAAAGNSGYATATNHSITAVGPTLLLDGHATTAGHAGSSNKGAADQGQHRQQPHVAHPIRSLFNAAELEATARTVQGLSNEDIGSTSSSGCSGSDRHCNGNFNSRHLNSASAASQLPGVFSIAMTLVAPSSYRTLIPSLADMTFRRTGVLTGPGLQVSSGWQMQRAVLGYTDTADDRAGYGVVQGWLSWQDLNADAVTWLQQQQQGMEAAADGSTDAGQSAVAAGGRPGSVQQQPGSVAMGSSGVQFELTCGNGRTQQACSLHVGGAVMVGNLGGTTASSCMVPARLYLPSSSSMESSSSSTGGSGVPPAAGAHPFVADLVHMELLLTTDEIRRTTFSIRSRPCVLGTDGTVQLADGSAGAFADLPAAAGGPSAFAVSSATVAASSSNSGSSGQAVQYQRGAVCSMQAQVPATQPADALDSSPGAVPSTLGGLYGGDSTGSNNSNSSAVLEKVVCVAANQLVAALSASNITKATSSDDTSNIPDPASTSSNNATGRSDSNSKNNKFFDPMQSQATATAVSAAQGLSVRHLAPEWVASLPKDTVYSFWCGMYWNGSWNGNVTAGVTAGSSGTAAMYLTGWPVAVYNILPRYGPSDIYVAAYSSTEQLQQLASGSSSADGIHWQGAATDKYTAAATAAAAGAGIRPAQLASGKKFPLGVVDGGKPITIAANAGWHQLLVVQGGALRAQDGVVVAAQTAIANNAVAAHDGGDSSEASAFVESWWPSPWDGWVPLVSVAGT